MSNLPISSLKSFQLVLAAKVSNGCNIGGLHSEQKKSLQTLLVKSSLKLHIVMIPYYPFFQVYVTYPFRGHDIFPLPAQQRADLQFFHLLRSREFLNCWTLGDGHVTNIKMIANNNWQCVKQYPCHLNFICIDTSGGTNTKHLSWQFMHKRLVKIRLFDGLYDVPLAVYWGHDLQTVQSLRGVSALDTGSSFWMDPGRKLAQSVIQS